MRVLVDELPNKPKDCIFYKKEYSRIPYSGDLVAAYRCSIDGSQCLNCKNCTKLRGIQNDN